MRKKHFELNNLVVDKKIIIKLKNIGTVKYLLFYKNEDILELSNYFIKEIVYLKPNYYSLNVNNEYHIINLKNYKYIILSENIENLINYFLKEKSDVLNLIKLYYDKIDELEKQLLKIFQDSLFSK